MRLIASLFVIAFAVSPLALAEPSLKTEKQETSVEVRSVPAQRFMTSAGSTIESIKTAAVLGALFIGFIMADDLWDWLDGREYPQDW